MLVEVGSRLSWALTCAMCSLALAGSGSAAAATSGACPAVAAPGTTSAALSVDNPAGSVVVGSSAAELAALIGSGGDPTTTYLVEYGTSTDYDLCTAAAALPATPGVQPVRVMLTGLQPATTYHFAVVATDGADTATGADQTLTTLPSGEIAQGATINGVPVGGMDETAMQRALRRLTAVPVRLSLEKRRWSTPRAQLGARIDAGRALASALQALPGQALTVPISVDSTRLSSYLAVANRRYGHPAQAPVVRLAGDHAVVIRARAGTEIATVRAGKAIAAYLAQGETSVLHLAVRRTPAPRSASSKAVVVRLDRQTLTAYLDGKPVLSAPVTTGRPALPTPIGSFSIHSRSSPYIFTSPWPKSSPYWYPPTPATWAMYFYDNDFLHDDPGEPASAYGAGSQDGPYASHGCVHVPRDAMAFLFQWLPVGATVIVARD